MRKAIYNSGIPENFKSVTCAFCRAARLSFAFLLVLLIASTALFAEHDKARIPGTGHRLPRPVVPPGHPAA